MSTPLSERSALLKLSVLGSLYFSQGLPAGFFTQALPLLLRKSGVSLSQIGLTTLLALPWALKFLWAPAVERHFLARFGKRKSWIVPLQLLAVLTLTVLAAFPAPEAIAPLLAATFLLNLLSATQDIATDGLAVDTLQRHELGWANGLQVGAYRFGMIVGGGFLLVAYEHIGARLTFACMACLTLLVTLPALLTPEPAHVMQAQADKAVHFVRRPGSLRIIMLLIAYKAGDAFATGMLRPFLADLGLGMADVGWLLGTVGFIAGLLGALTGGALVNRLGHKRALLGFGLAQALSVAGYAYLASTKPDLKALYVACAAEHFAGGMATAALFTCMMSWCSKSSGGTDYTVQASAVVVATGLSSTLSGFSAQALGYFWHFCVATAACFVSLILAARWFPEARHVALIRAESET
jgi:RhtX/FptX family siderophore transporter